MRASEKGGPPRKAASTRARETQEHGPFGSQGKQECLCHRWEQPKTQAHVPCLGHPALFRVTIF